MVMARIIFQFCFITAFGLSAAAQTLPKFSVREAQLTTIDTDDREKMLKAMKIFEQVINDPDFQKELLTQKFLFDLPNDPMRHLTTKQIVDTLYSGKEWYDPVVDNTADIYWICNKRKHKPPFSTAIGYGLPTDSTIHTYIYFVRNASLSEIANNLAHEWSHKVGFDHEFKDHKDRDQTVPYLFGDLVEKYAKRYE